MKFINFIIIFSLIFNLSNCEKKKKNLLPIQNQVTMDKSGNVIIAKSSASANIADTTPAVTAVYETEAFSYQTMRIVTIDATVVDGSDQPITGAVVEIRDTSNTNTIYQQVSNASGRVQGSLNLNTTETTIYVYVIYKGVTTPAKAVVVRTGDNKVLVRITQIKIDLPTSVLTATVAPTNGGTNLTDSDGDGVLDSIDDYPNDPNKATKLKFPTNGVNTIAFEDMFPTAGDADLNDTVVVYYIEEDLNAAGQIVEIRGNYQYMAHGSGYQHSLYLRLPSTVNVTYSSEVRNGNGVLLANAAMTKSKTEATGINSFTPSVTDLQDGLRILGNTNTTIGGANWNSRATDTTYANGHLAKIKIIFNTPVTRSVLGLAPYDTFIRNESRLASEVSYPAQAPRAVTSAGSFQVFEVHRSGFYKFTSSVTVDGDLREVGEDIYIDKNNFPFGVIVPGLWKWPAESRDLRNPAQTGYPKFANWTTTQGVQDADWYLDSAATTSTNNYYSKVVTNRAALDTPNSQLLAFLGASSLAQYQVLLAAIVISVLGYLIFKKKFKKA